MMPVVLMMPVLRMKQLVPMVLVALMLQMAYIANKTRFIALRRVDRGAYIYTRHVATPASVLNR